MTFSGSVSAQASTGETVTLTVTLPDSTTETFTTTTNADGTYSIGRNYTDAGAYSVTAHVDADGKYKACDSPVVPFIIELSDRTITVTVN